MSFRYIGSKARLVEQIKSKIGPLTDGFFVDSFCGTGAVAEAAADLGWPVRINDHMVSATILTAARLLSKDEVTFENLGGYNNTLEYLNEISPIEGFIWRSYSPASLKFEKIERRYFTPINAGKIDAIRLRISKWKDESAINVEEERLLLADLLGATNRVANIAGTYGCFLAKWTPQASNELMLKPRILKSRQTITQITVGDVFQVPTFPNDVVYLDPPYTKRQYASYYHILETVAIGDSPIIEGVCGLRPWKDRASDFCYKTRALKTLSDLIRNTKANRILLSYSSEGHIGIEELKEELSDIGSLDLFPLGKIGRYRPNKVASENASDVKEFLIAIDREEVPQVQKIMCKELVA